MPTLTRPGGNAASASSSSSRHATISPAAARPRRDPRSPRRSRSLHQRALERPRTIEIGLRPFNLDSIEMRSCAGCAAAAPPRSRPRETEARATPLRRRPAHGDGRRVRDMGEAVDVEAMDLRTRPLAAREQLQRRTDLALRSAHLSVVGELVGQVAPKQACALWSSFRSASRMPVRSVRRAAGHRRARTAPIRARISPPPRLRRRARRDAVLQCSLRQCECPARVYLNEKMGLSAQARACETCPADPLDMRSPFVSGSHSRPLQIETDAGDNLDRERLGLFMTGKVAA